MPANVPERLRLTLTAMTPSGECVAQHDDRDVFVAFGLPGEVVEVEIVHRRRNFVWARIVQVLEPSPERVAPPCPHFGACGGCAWQHIAYDAQLRFKREIVREQLRRIGHVAELDVRPCIPSPTDYGYRNRIQLAASPNGRLGYRARASHAVVEINECPIADARLNTIIANTTMKHVGNVDLRVRDDDALHMTVGAYRYRVNDQSFFQVNSGVAELLVGEVLRAVDFRSGQRVLDLYCGVGLFTVPLAVVGARITGIEQSATSVEDARHNLHEAGCADWARVIAANVRDGLQQPDVISEQWDTVVVDPPRTGIERESLLALVALQPRTIVYVSCDPASLARDVKVLVKYGWTLIYAQPLDMFPQTHHVETVALLRRRAVD